MGTIYLTSVLLHIGDSGVSNPQSQVFTEVKYIVPKIFYNALRLDEIEMRHDVEEGIRELDAGEGISHDEVFNDLLSQQT